MTTKVVHLKKSKYDILICRTNDNQIPEVPKQGCLGNPIFLRNPKDDKERAEVILKYHTYFHDRLKSDQTFKEYIHTLKDKTLACWCAPKPCHGNVIADYLDSLTTPNFIHGDMFAKLYDARVNTINCVGVMGAGVALQFRKRYPKMFEKYREACFAGKIKPGSVYIYRTPEECIINFTTKDHWRDNSKYEWIESGLRELRLFLEHNEDMSIAIPALGCSNGGLDWSKVSKMVNQHLIGLKAQIDVYHPL